MFLFSLQPTRNSSTRNRPLTCGKCTGRVDGQPAGEPRSWSPAAQKAGRRRGGAGTGVQTTAHTEWGRSRGPGSAGAFPVTWLRRRPRAGPTGSSREIPGSMTIHPESADRHWSKGWCAGPSLVFFLLDPLFHFLLTSHAQSTPT